MCWNVAGTPHLHLDHSCGLGRKNCRAQQRVLRLGLRSSGSEVDSPRHTGKIILVYLPNSPTFENNSKFHSMIIYGCSSNLQYQMLYFECQLKTRKSLFASTFNKVFFFIIINYYFSFLDLFFCLSILYLVWVIYRFLLTGNWEKLNFNRFHIINVGVCTQIKINLIWLINIGLWIKMDYNWSIRWANHLSFLIVSLCCMFWTVRWRVGFICVTSLYICVCSSQYSQFANYFIQNWINCQRQIDEKWNLILLL